MRWSLFTTVLLALSGPGTNPTGVSYTCPDQDFVETSLEGWMRNIALVTMRGSSESSEVTGLGLVTGWAEGQAFIAVPSHLIYGRRDPSNISVDRDSLSVLLFGDVRRRRLCPHSQLAPNPRNPDGTADLTFVCVEWSLQPFFSGGAVARSVRLGDRVVLIGEPGVVRVSNKRGVLAKATSGAFDDNGGDIQVDELEGVPGQSGAALANPAGLVGIYLGGGRGGSAVSIGAARRIALAMDVPWSLGEHESFDCKVLRRVCISSDGSFIPKSINFTNVFRPSVVTVSSQGCADVPEGKYEIAVPDGSIECEPQLARVMSGAQSLDIALTCAPRLAGSWVTDAGDVFDCVHIGTGKARCGGLASLQVGFIEGLLTAQGAKVSFSGSFQAEGAVPRTGVGEFTWTKGRLSGGFRRDGYPLKSVELRLRAIQ